MERRKFQLSLLGFSIVTASGLSTGSRANENGLDIIIDHTKRLSEGDAAFLVTVLTKVVFDRYIHAINSLKIFAALGFRKQAKYWAGELAA